MPVRAPLRGGRPHVFTLTPTNAKTRRLAQPVCLLPFGGSSEGTDFVGGWVDNALD